MQMRTKHIVLGVSSFAIGYFVGVAASRAYAKKQQAYDNGSGTLVDQIEDSEADIVDLERELEEEPS